MGWKEHKGRALGAGLGSSIPPLSQALDCLAEAQNPTGTQRALSGQGCTLNPPSELNALITYCSWSTESPSSYLHPPPPRLTTHPVPPTDTAQPALKPQAEATTLKLTSC